MTSVQITHLDGLLGLAQSLDQLTNNDGHLYVYFEPGVELPVYDEGLGLVIGKFVYDPSLENIVFAPEEYREPLRYEADEDDSDNH